MGEKVTAGILFGIVDGERNWLAGRVKQRERIAAGVAQRGSGLVNGELVTVCCQRLPVVLEGGRPSGMACAIADGQHAENKERGDLNDVDGQVDSC